MPNDIARPETVALETDSLARAQSLVIASNEDYAAADAFSVGLLALERAIVADFRDAKAAAFAAHRAITAQEAGHLDSVQQARALIRPKLVAWEAKKRQEAEVERVRLEAQARKEAEDRAIAEAAEAERNGDMATAAAIVAAPVQAAPVIVAPALPKRQTKIPEAWAFRVTNQALIPREYLTVDQIKLGGVARATKGSIKVPGVEFYDKNAA